MASSGAPASLLLGRREALIFLASLPVALAGCGTRDPAVNEPGIDGSGNGGSSTNSASTPLPTPTAAPSAQIARGAALELALADLAGTTNTGKQQAQLSKDQRRLLAAVQAGHLDHANALQGADATNGSTSAAGPATVPGDQALAVLVRRERAAARSHAKAALDSSGSAALLWASMSVAASRYAAALGHDGDVPIGSSKRGQLPALSVDQAVAELVAQLHALVYGYQLAIGKLPVLGKRHARAVTELLRVRVLRERLISILTKRSITVPIPQPAYVPSLRVHDAASAEKLIARMQSALLPFCGLFVTAATGKDRQLAFDTLAATARIARSWGGPLSAWPGWP
ncbi:MAG TPA: DUF4439 domain-containing protein [Propionibacteriaceae bacterium]|nr:DUF4439 domain-containing protein [Propionibacteriaceae bacterium]